MNYSIYTVNIELENLRIIKKTIHIIGNKFSDNE